MLTTNNISPKPGTKLDDIMTRLSEPMKIDLSVLNSMTRESGFMRHLRISLTPSESEAGESTVDYDEDQLQQSRRISRAIRRIHGRFEDSMDKDSSPESAAGGIAPSEGRESEESMIATTCHGFLPKFLDDGCLSKCITMSDSMPSRNIPICLNLDRAVSSTDSAIKRNNNNNNNNTPVGAPPHAARSAMQAIISMGINVHPSTLGINASHSNERHRRPPSMGTTISSPCPPAPAPEPTKLSLDALFPTGTAPAPAPPASYPMHSRGLPQRPWEKTNTSTMSPVLNNVNVNVPAVGAHNTQRIHQQQPICLSLANLMALETKSESSSTPMNNNVGTGAGAGAGGGTQKEIVSLESMLGGEASVNKHDNGDAPTTTTTTSGRGVTESNGSTFNHTKVTTMMIRNLPKEVTQSQLLKLLNETGFRTQYDFVYLPCCFTKKTNIGYAFVNFLSRSVAYAFRDTWQNSPFLHKETQGREPTSTVNVTVAQVQGKEMNIQRLIRECRCSKITNPKFQPVVYENGVRVNFVDFARTMVEAEDEDNVLRKV